MMQYKKIHLLFATIYSLMIVSWGAYAQNQWNENGIKAADASAPSIGLNAVSDDSGYVYFTYQDTSVVGDYDIFAQKLDLTGRGTWTASGVNVHNTATDQKNPSIAADGSGGAYVAWYDKDADKIFIQNIDKDGNLSWIETGIEVCTDSSTQQEVKLISDNAGGVYVVWKDKRNGNADIYAQHFTISGSRSWPDSGVAVTTAVGIQSSYKLHSSRSGDLLIVWVDERNGNRDIYAQKITSSGTVSWNVDGTAVVTETSVQYQPAIEQCGAKYIITWTDKRTDTGDIYAQLLDENGNALWATNGIIISDAANTQDGSRITESDSSSTIISWWDSRSGGYDIYAQRIDSLGTALWTTVINNYTDYQYLPEITTDGAGGAFVVWMDSRNDYYDLYIQHVDKTGQLQWNSEGIPLVTASGYQADQKVVSDRSGGCITIWLDKRDNQTDIYAQLTNDNISFTSPSSGDIWDGTSPQTVTWSLNTDEIMIDHLALRASAAVGDNYPYVITENVSPVQLNQSWTNPGINSTDVTIKIQALNKKDSVICTYLSDTFTVDSESPLDFSLLTPPDNETVEKIITFEWNSTTDNLTGLSHYELWIDGSLLQDDLTDTTYTLLSTQSLSTGPHTWTVRAVDNAGVYREPTEYTINVVYDNTPPEDFHLLTPQNNSWTTFNNPTFSWESSTDPGRTLKNYKFYLDGNFIADISPHMTSFTEPILTPGDHTWYIVAVDSADNTTQSQETWTIRMDNEPPFPFSLLQPETNIWINDTTPEFSWQATSDTSTGVGLAEYELWIDDELTIDNIAADNQSIQLPPSKSLSQGIHTWYINAKDSLGNSRNSQTEYNLKVDILAPSSFDLISPENKSYINSLNPDFNWNPSNDTLSGLEKYQLWIDGYLNKDNISLPGTKPAALLSEGEHLWSITALDSAGNIRTVTTYSFISDTTPPRSFQPISPKNNDTLYIKTPQLIWQTSHDTLSGIKNYSLLIDGNIVAENISPPDTVYSVTQELNNGIHTWQVTSTDSAGNAQSTETFQFTISCNAPVITSSDQVQAVEDQLFTYTAQAYDPDQQDITFSFADYPSWLTPSQDSISGTPGEGVQDTSFMAIATDGIYYDSLQVQVTVQPVNDPPVITSAAQASAEEDQLFTYTASAQDPDNETLQYLFTDYPTWLTPLDNSISGIPTEGKTDTSFTLIVTDGELSDTLEVSLPVTPVNDPPRITSSDLITVKEDSLLSYIATADDPDNEILTYNYIEKPFWLSATDQKIEGYAREEYTDTTCTVVVSDGILSDTLRISIDIIYINDPPLLTSSSTATAFEDSLFTYEPQAEDSDSDIITYSFTDYPGWLIPDTNTISGTPTEGKQDTSFIVIVSDGALSDTMKINLNVIPVNDPPYITSPDTGTATEKESFSYLATAEDIDSKDISISFSDYPSWLTVSGEKIKGTPGDNCQDTSFTVIASDGKLSDSLKVSLTVIPVNDPPVFIKPLPKDTTISAQDTLVQYLGDFINDPDDPLSSLTWHHTVLDTNTLTITFNQKTHVVKINGNKTNGKVSIIFKVSDPQDSSARDTLQFSINKNTSINDQHLSDIPEHFILENNYPNPFNNSTTIKYGLPRNSTVTLYIYNLLGQKVAELIDNKKQTAGFHQIHLDSGSLPSGIYFYHLQTESWDSIKKMILMK